jgi:hypothetical protein
VRAAPHEGPPRLPRRATTHQPVAHLATRRHRDHHPRSAGTATARSRRLPARRSGPA